MVDTASSTALFSKKAEVHHSIQQEHLEALLGIIVNSLRISDSVSDAKSQLPRILPDWLDPEFIKNRTDDQGNTPTAFYLQPNTEHTSDLQRNHNDLLALEDVVSIFESVLAHIEAQRYLQRYADNSILNGDQLKLLDRIKNKQLNLDIHILRADSQDLYSTIVALKGRVDVKHAIDTIEEELPLEPFGRISDQTEELHLGVSWETVKPFVTSVSTTQITSNVVRYEHERSFRMVRVPAVRKFLNRWLFKLYRDYEQKFKEVHLPLSRSELFHSSDSNAAYFDIPNWLEVDEDIAQFILNTLAPEIEAYLKTNTGIGGLPIPSKKSTESDEEERELTKEAQTTEELETLAEKFAAAGASYRAESQRLTAILLPQFFAAHGFIDDGQASFSESLDTLRQYDPSSYALVYREFQVELETVLRSLGPDEFARLKSGDSIGFRMTVLRKLYSKLGTNPRFVGALGRYRDQFIEKLETEAENTESVKEKDNIINRLKKLNTRSNTDDIKFDTLVEKTEKRRGKEDDWAADSHTQKSDRPAPISDFSQFSKLTQADLEAMLFAVTKEKLDYPKLFRNLDLVIAERWSPDQLRGMSATDAAVILGISLGELKNDPHKYGNFINILVQYLYVRRQRLADHYQRDALSRDRSQPDESAGPEQVAKLQELQLLADQLTEKGGANAKSAGEIIAAARALDTQDILELRRNGHQLATFIGAVHSIEKNDRKAKFETEQEKKKNDFFAEGVTISKKRKMLEDLGFFASELDAYQDEPGALNKLYQDSLAEQHKAYLGHDGSDGEYDFLSYYEDQDDEGVVQDAGYISVEEGSSGYRNPGRQRYGTPGKARSLAKGSISTLHRLQELKTKQKRAKEVKKRLQQLRQGAQTATRLLVANKELVATGVVAGAGLLRGYQILQNGGVFSKLFGGLGAIGGGIGGGWAGTFLPIPLAGTGGGVVAGSALGGWGGMELGYALDKQTGFALDKLFGTGAGQAPAAAAAYTPPVLPAASALHPTNTALAATSSSSAQTIGVTATQWTAIGTTVAYTTTTMLGAGAIYNSLQPPPLGTLGSNGTESKYVILQKVASNADGTAPNGTVPAEIKYQLWIEARDDYRIEVTSFTDVFSVRTNSQERGDQPSPATPSCSDITFENLKSRINSDDSSSNPIAHKNGTPDPGEVVGEDGRIFVGECTVNFDGSYNHTGVLNTFTVNFTTTGSDGTPVEDTAETAELVCFGKCPQRRQGVWPTNGMMTQGPFGSFSHGTADAIDISNRAGPNIYAPYTGTAYFFINDDININKNPATAGLDKNYGNHVILVTEDGFVLLFAHMDAASPFVDKINGQEVVPGGSYQITEPCTKLGKMGSTGWSEGTHLHYEYRVHAGRSWYSYSTGGRKILETVVPFPFENNKSVTTDCGS